MCYGVMVLVKKEHLKAFYRDSDTLTTVTIIIWYRMNIIRRYQQTIDFIITFTRNVASQSLDLAD